MNEVISYSELLNQINRTSEISCILVTGPQRSGTGITTRILAHDLGWQLFMED